MLDPLTGLHNRRYAQERLMAEMSRAERMKTTLTVLMVDLDELKKINDGHGHGSGRSRAQNFWRTAQPRHSRIGSRRAHRRR